MKISKRVENGVEFVYLKGKPIGDFGFGEILDFVQSSPNYKCLKLQNLSSGAEAILCNDPNFKETKQNRNGIIIYELTGTSQAVNERIAAIKEEYPSQGYGTWSKPIMAHEDGKVTVEVRRSNSCD